MTETLFPTGVLFTGPRIDAATVAEAAQRYNGPSSVAIHHGLNGCRADCAHIVGATTDAIRRYVSFGRDRNQARGYGAAGRVVVVAGDVDWSHDLF
jgi:hypothetical protein